MRNDIVKWLPQKEIDEKTRYAAVDVLIQQWAELRECLGALAKRCNLLEGKRVLKYFLSFFHFVGKEYLIG